MSTAAPPAGAPRRNYLGLFVALTFVSILYPLLPLGAVPRLALGVASLALILSSVRSVWSERRVLWIVAVFGLGFAVVETANSLAPTPLYQGLTDLFSMGLIATVGGSIVLHVARSRRVTMDTVYGAACAYLMLGLFWGCVYRLLYWSDATAFRLPWSEGISPEAGTVQGWLGYFSIITLTTVGYGDVTPVSPVARALVMVEALSGQLYVAIMLARLVGLEIAGAMSGRRPSD